MSSEKLGSAKELLKGNLGGSWDLLEGCEGNYTELGVAKNFGGAAAAYSLRDIGAMNSRVVKVRRDSGETTDPEEDFSANQVQGGGLQDWVNGKLEAALPADVATAAAAYSLRKVKASYGIPTTVVNGTENFPAIVPLAGSAVNIGNGFTVHRFADGVADSGSVTVSNETITVTAIASGTGSFSAGCRLKGLADGKQYTVSGEFRVTSQGADGDGVALVDISDDTVGTDEDSITTASTTFTPFFIDAGYNSGSNGNHIDFQANSSGSNSGTITAEFRNIKIIENNNSAVRIRRSSDDEEVVVGFDSNDKVSASSPITATPSGSTTASTLGDFLNESNINIGMGNSFFDQNDQVDMTGVSATGFTATIAKNNTSDIDIRAGGQAYPNVKKGTITLSYNIVQNTLSNSFTIQLWQLVSGQGYEIVDTVSAGTTGTRSITFENTDATGSIVRFVSSDHLVNDGEVLKISDLSITASKHTATVHTWYDQAAANNAVQETATNQPQVAANGAVLADGLLFDDSDDFLQSSNQVLTGTGNNSLYCVVKTLADNGYIAGSAGTGVGMSIYAGTTKFILSNNNSAGTTAQDTIPMINNKTVLVSANFDDGTTDSLNLNGNSNEYANGSSAYSITAGPKFTIGARDGSAVEAVMYKGSIQEIIAYDSFQGANRFKIESNINNYYGLYNDENDIIQSTWQNDGSEGTFTSTSVDGFTYENSSNTAFIGVTLSNTLALNDSVFVSFNATGVTHPDSSNQSPQIRLRDGVGSGSSGASTVINQVTNGFNSFTLTYNDSGKSNGQHIVFSEGDTGGDPVTISDFKVSRVARNGFVDTWYDQSGNGHDVSQSTPANQPKIILNGGQDSQGIHFDQDQSLSRSDSGTPVQASAFFTLVATRDENTTRPTLAGAGADIAWNTDDNFMLRANSENSRTTTTNAMDTERNREYLLSVSVNSSRVPKFYINENTETESALTADIGNAFKYIGGDSGANATFGLNGRINEAIAFNGDKTSDVDAIRANQNSYYNTY
tara:strand:+ start:873 stop:3920 length:3048 start_codon:yes stop_codon:yes gene_type:complete